MNAARSGDQFFCGWGRNLWFRNRTRKKVYRRQKGERVGEYFGKPTMMDEFKNFIGVLVSIFYWHSVVGGFVNCTGVIYGVRTSLFLTSQRMPSRYVAYRCIYNYKNIIILWMWSWKFIYKCMHAVRSGDQFFIHRTEIYDFVVRWDKKVYRRQEWVGFKRKFENKKCDRKY